MKTRNAHSGKKGQMKIQQTAFMLIALTLFFALVGIFILGFSLSGLKEKANLIEQEKAMILVSKLANSPEFSCAKTFKNKVNCIDLDKVMALKERIEKYEGFWEIGNIEIIKIYPKQEGVCTKENYPNCGKIILKKEDEGIYTSNFVVLCRKDFFMGVPYDKCELGKVMISYTKK